MVGIDTPSVMECMRAVEDPWHHHHPVVHFSQHRGSVYKRHTPVSK
jgi:hypothetical protein